MEKLKFYAEQKSVEINPLEESGELRYILEGLSEDINEDSFRVKLAFPAKLGIASQSLKNTIRSILVEVLDIASFHMEKSGDNLVIYFATRALKDPGVLPQEGTINVPIVVKLIKHQTATSPAAEYKCLQEIELVTGGEGDEHGESGEYKSEQESNAGLYSGLLAIDYGTSNSSVAVRDPAFASEEVRGQLGTEQWNSLCDWMNIWLTEHLSTIEANNSDVFVQNLTVVVPTAQFPECGSPRSEISQALNRFDDKLRSMFLSELVSRLSNYVTDGGDAKIVKSLSAEVMAGFEAVIDSKNLESQRYFVLELDKNVGPAPISSVLQIISAPNTSNEDVLIEETKVDMGARVGLLLHSAATGDLDIRQFVISSKRYFGRNETITVIPAESNGEKIEFSADLLAKLTYKELFTRAVSDIHRRADEGKFEDAEWPCSVVATFPSSYPSAFRQMLKEMLYDLNIKEIDARFDEATSAAIYYIWREIGADPVCGMHGLMARSRKDKYGRSYQNILLYDMGGGTTDIALIQLLYEELEIFEEGEDRGHGGSYFRITPRLLGTTGHAYLGGDLATLWIFRYIKTRLADLILTHITQNNLEPPMDAPIAQLLVNLPEELASSEGEALSYRPGALMAWMVHPSQSLPKYNKLNEQVIDIVVPTRFVNDSHKISNFFTLWEITDELKKTLGTPIIDHFGTCLGSGLPSNWPDELELDSGQLYTLIQMCQPWLADSGMMQQEHLHIVVKQEEMNHMIKDTVRQSVSLAVSLASARLRSMGRNDRVDRLILSGLSCNMKVIQDVSREVFIESDGIFDYDAANVCFDRDSAKTAVPLGACIGRYMESVRVDPQNEKTQQLLRDGYDQIELVIENLFSYLPCRIAYDSLVAMVTIFEQGQELNVKSYWDDRLVIRTSLKDLRPVQEKFWVYRIDFVGAEPQYLGLIDAEAVAGENDFAEFRKFREEFVVGFEVDAELLLRCFFLPKGQKNIKPAILHQPIEEADISFALGEELRNIDQEMQTVKVVQRSIEVTEALEDVIALEKGTPLEFKIEYPDGTVKACCLSKHLHIQPEYEFRTLPAKDSDEEEKFASKFEIDHHEAEEVTLIVDEDGHMTMTTKCLYDISIWAEIEYVAQKVDYDFDPFCGLH